MIHRGWAAAKLILLGLFVVGANPGVASRLADLGGRPDLLALSIFALLWAVALAGLLIAATRPRLWARLAWAAPILISVFLGNLHRQLAGAQLSFFDVVLYWSERAHLLDAAQVYQGWLAWPFLLAGLGLLTFALPPGLRLPFSRWLAPAPILPFALVAALVLAEGGRGTRGLPEQFLPLGMLATLALEDPLAESPAGREPVALPRHDVPASRHLVLVIDEGVRADFLDVNGARNVPPYLATQADRFANFGYSVAANNCSLFANLILRYGGMPDDLAARLRTNPSIWSYAHAAGLRTVYVDSQRTRGRLQNGMTVIERGELDEFIQLDHVPGQERDFRVAELLADLLAREEPHFIYVNKKGTHFPYAKNYPPEDEHFVPAMTANEGISSDRERLINSYRNSLRRNVDGFFRRLLAADLSHTIVLYTSDHGQNLLDRGVLTQCNAYDPHFFEAVVPLLVTSGDAALLARFKQAAEQNRDRTTHFEIFPTLLRLLGHDAEPVRSTYGLSLLDPLPVRMRAFTYGPVLMQVGREVRWRAVPENLRERAEATRP